MKWFKVWTSDLSAPVLLIKAADAREAIRKAREDGAHYDQAKEYKPASRCPHHGKQEITTYRWSLTGKQYPVKKTVGYCMATADNRFCTCKGIKANCDFYPEYRAT